MTGGRRRLATWRALLLALAVLLPGRLAAHTVILLEGDLVLPGDASAVLVVEVTPAVLGVLAGTAPPTTKAAVADLMPALARRCAAGLRLQAAFPGAPSGTTFLPPTEVQTLDAAQQRVWPPGTPCGAYEGLLLVWALPGEPLDAPTLHLVLPPGELVSATVSVAVQRLAPGQDSSPGESLGATLGRHLVLGFRHIIPEGFDHLLFVTGLFLGTRRWRSLALLITAFTVGHCLTLGLALSLGPAGTADLGGWLPRAVESGIALSIVVMAVAAARMPGNASAEPPVGGRAVLALAFGLVHGLGFAGALGQIAWPTGRFLPALVATNLGIELGQATAVAALALATCWAWDRPWYRTRVVLPACAVIGAVGLGWTVQRLLA